MKFKVLKLCFCLGIFASAFSNTNPNTIGHPTIFNNHYAWENENLNDVRTSVVDNNGNEYIATGDKGLVEIENGSENPTPLMLTNQSGQTENNINDLSYSSKTHTLVIGGDLGIWVFNTENKQIIYCSNLANDLNVDGFSSNVSEIAINNSGDICWMIYGDGNLFSSSLADDQLYSGKYNVVNLKYNNNIALNKIGLMNSKLVFTDNTGIIGAVDIDELTKNLNVHHNLANITTISLKKSSYGDYLPNVKINKFIIQNDTLYTVDNNNWVMTYDGQVVFKTGCFKFKILITNMKVNNLGIDDKGGLWVSGINTQTNKDQIFIVFKNNKYTTINLNINTDNKYNQNYNFCVRDMGNDNWNILFFTSTNTNNSEVIINILTIVNLYNYSLVQLNDSNQMKKSSNGTIKNYAQVVIGGIVGGAIICIAIFCGFLINRKKR